MPLACGQFKEKILEFKEGLNQAMVLLGEYQKNGQEEKVKEARMILGKNQEKIDSFKGNVQYETEIILKRWFKRNFYINFRFPGMNLEEGVFLDNIKFDIDGRVIYNDALTLMVEPPRQIYLPALIKKINGNCTFSSVGLVKSGPKEYVETVRADGIEEVGGDFRCAYKRTHFSP